MIVVYAGRLPGPEFPREHEQHVHDQLKLMLAGLRPRLVVGSAAAGGDLLALAASTELTRFDIKRHIVLPGDAEEFRSKSVVVRGDPYGVWSRRFDDVRAAPGTHVAAMAIPTDDSGFRAASNEIVRFATAERNTDEPVIGLRIGPPLKRSGPGPDLTAHVADTLQNLGCLVLTIDTARATASEAFVAMPRGLRDLRPAFRWTGYDADLSYERIFVPALVGAGFVPRRMENYGGGAEDSIMRRHLDEADFFVADLTGNDPNVLWELGIRQAVRADATALVCLRGGNVPFDVARVPVRWYVRGERSISDQELVESIRSLLPSFLHEQYGPPTEDHTMTEHSRALPENTGRSGVQNAGSLPSTRSDAPSDSDELDIAGEVDMLAKLAVAKDTNLPLSVALLGDWGSGKSTFMLHMRRRVEELTDISRLAGNDSPFVNQVRQIGFNAWHYSDDQVWVGLVDRLFRVLAADVASKDEEPFESPEAVIDERARLHGERDELRDKERRIAEDLRQIDDTPRGRGWFAQVVDPLYVVRTGRASASDLWADLISSHVVLLRVFVVIVALALTSWLAGPVLTGAAAVLVSAAVPLVTLGVAVLLPAWKGYRAATVLAKRERKRLEDTRDKTLRQLEAIAEQLVVVDAAAALATFLTDRGATSSYESHRGLVGKVRDDLEQLVAQLNSAREQWEHDGSKGTAPIERIVLYVDDLDRCPPQRVVEVLGAVHLLLALPLFVVVVAVDARWLMRSLGQHQYGMFAARGATMPTVRADVVASPLDYLDKIFQIPFSLRHMGDRAEHYLSSLLPEVYDNSRDSSMTETEGGQADHENVEASTAAPVASAGQEANVPIATSSPPDNRRSRQRREIEIISDDLRWTSVRISRAEREFIPRLHRLIPTPRAGKKLVNLYRLVRIGIDPSNLDAFVGNQKDGGPYQVVGILLATLVGRPDVAHNFFRLIRTGPGDLDVAIFLESDAVLNFSGSGNEGLQSIESVDTLCSELADVIREIRRRSPVFGQLAEYQRWCTQIERFSFTTHRDLPPQKAFEKTEKRPTATRRTARRPFNGRRATWLPASTNHSQPSTQQATEQDTSLRPPHRRREAGPRQVDTEDRLYYQIDRATQLRQGDELVSLADQVDHSEELGEAVRNRMRETIGHELVSLDYVDEAREILAPLAEADSEYANVTLQCAYAHTLIRGKHAPDQQLTTAQLRLRFLLRQHGPNAEASGLLGSAAKELAVRAHQQQRGSRAWVRHAVDAAQAYESGYRVDANAYYSGVNAVAMYRMLGQHWDTDNREVHLRAARELLAPVRFVVDDAMRAAEPSGWVLATDAELRLHAYLLDNPGLPPDAAAPNELVDLFTELCRRTSGSEMLHISMTRQLSWLRTGGDPPKLLAQLIESLDA